MTTYRRYGLRLLIALLVVVYTLTNAGRFHIVDEVSLFALTESVMLRAAVDTNAIAWTQWVNSPGEVLGEFGLDGQVFSKKGPAPALVAGPWYWLLRSIARLNIQIGLLQGTLLWNGLVTALTAALLWLTATRLGYSDRMGLVVGLLYGLATIAWPYANHYFGEPLSALSLLICFYALATYRQSGRLRWLWLAGSGAALAVATVTAHVVLVAVFTLYWLWVETSNLWGARSLIRQEASRIVLRLFLAVSAFGAPLMLAGGLLLWYNRVRFGDPFVTGYHFDSGEGFTTPFWQGFWGLMVSPYRGVFWHTPLLLATPVGLFYFVRRHRAEAILITVLSAVLVGLYSVWWMWWGGFAWGPRFLVPLTPLWVLVLAPFVQRLVASDWRLETRDWRSEIRDWRAGEQSLVSGLQSLISDLQSLKVAGALLLSLTIVSLIVQLLAVTVNYVNYESELRRIFPTDEANPLAYGPPAQRLAEWRYSPVIGQLRLIGDGLRANSDLAWLRADGALNMRTLVIGFAGLSTLLAALWGWWRSGVEPKEDQLPSWPVRNVVPLLSLLVMAAWLGDSSRDPLYGAPNQGYRAILAEVCAQAQPGDALVTVAPYDYHIPMNWLGGLCNRGMPIFGYAPASMEHAETQEVLGRVVQAYSRIWFVTSGLPPNDAENGVELWLAGAAYKADDRWFDTYRLVRYATPVALANSQNVPLDMFLNTPDWEQITIWAVRAPGAVRPAEIMPVELVYQLDTPVRGDLRWFVQLLTPDDYVVALIDTAPAQGYTSFSSLPVGVQFVEKVALQLPDRLAPGRYRLIAGLYDPAAPNPNRLLTPTGRDHVDLGIIVVR